MTRPLTNSQMPYDSGLKSEQKKNIIYTEIKHMEFSMIEAVRDVASFLSMVGFLATLLLFLGLL